VPLYDWRCENGHRFERAVPLRDFSQRQSCECGSDARRVISAPRIRSDVIEPRMGADGKLHDSLASYRRSLTPEGNRKGERYLELGNEELPAFKPPEFDRKERREAIRAGIADVKAGRVPPVVTGDLTP
jgi:putative FmdB family regulatory protein